MPDVLLMGDGFLIRRTCSAVTQEGKGKKGAGNEAKAQKIRVGKERKKA